MQLKQKPYAEIIAENWSNGPQISLSPFLTSLYDMEISFLNENIKIEIDMDLKAKWINRTFTKTERSALTVTIILNSPSYISPRDVFLFQDMKLQNIIIPGSSGKLDYNLFAFANTSVTFFGFNISRTEFLTERLETAINNSGIIKTFENKISEIKKQSFITALETINVPNTTGVPVFSNIRSATYDPAILIEGEEGFHHQCGIKVGNSLVGYSWVCSYDTGRNPGYLKYGPYQKTQFPGLNKAEFWLKSYDIISDQVLVSIDVFDATETEKKMLNYRRLTGKDFDDKGQFKKFTLNFEAVSDHLYEYRTYWHGQDAAIFLDKVVVAPVHLFERVFEAESNQNKKCGFIFKDSKFCLDFSEGPNHMDFGQNHHNLILGDPNFFLKCN